ncbi:MAG: methyltransferase domain-containing protein [bacterium]|nr:methyltransferase domain-containing protein [bacterium]MDE0600207.1 methyltransferase domain-containing protein [bacterium]
MGFSRDFLQVLSRLTASTHAAYLLPHLRPGLRVLDFGCGPGTISVGLAEAIAPGVLHGIDMEETQISLAKATAKARGRRNAVYQVGDVTALPFEDEFFDVAHCHNVLMHVPDTRAALTEVKRVLKPGGIIGCREMICESSFINPDFGILGEAWRIFMDLLEADDGHAQMGKDIKAHLIDTGFANLQITASFTTYSTPEEVFFGHRIANRWLLSREITEAAIKYGAATQTLWDDIQIGFDEWKKHPGAFAGIAYGEAVANKPQS